MPPGGEKLDFRGVQGFDETNAFVMASGKGPQSAVYKTVDGCTTWKLVLSDPDPDGFFDALQFDHAYRMHGTLLGDPVNGAFVLFQTLDGGSHWTRAVSTGLAAAAPGIGAFAASNTSYDELHNTFGTGGPGGPYLYTLDPQCTMLRAQSDPDGCFRDTLQAAAQKLPMAGTTASQGIFSIVGPVAVGGDYTKPNESQGTAAFRDPLFEGWLPAKAMPHGYRSAVAHDKSSDTWIAVGPNGTDISLDDGRDWTPLKPSPADDPDADKNWNAISLPFVVGSKGKIGKLKPGILGK